MMLDLREVLKTKVEKECRSVETLMKTISKSLDLSSSCLLLRCGPQRRQSNHLPNTYFRDKNTGLQSTVLSIE